MTVKVLSLSDIQLDSIYSAWVATRFGDIDLILGCGDLAYYYLEFVISMLNKPLYYVRGNHSSVVEYTVTGNRTHPLGGIDLHRRIIVDSGLILAGVEGSLKYRNGPFQYSQLEMWLHVLRMVPALIKNRFVYGRYLDVLITHAPPWGIHDKPDLPHQGIKAFRWLLRVFRPAYHFHGHIHLYRHDEIRETKYLSTKVINSYGYLETVIYQPTPGFAPLRFFRKRSFQKNQQPF